MSFFNEKQTEALRTGIYYCSECGSEMIKEDDELETLICLNCGHEVDFDRYGFENDEEYEAQYPSKEDVYGYDDDDDEDDDLYEEINGELDRS